MVLADILKRWQILLGNTDAQLLTGTDEHGMKVQKAATEARMDPQAFCDMNCQKFEVRIPSGHCLQNPSLPSEWRIGLSQSCEHRL